MMAQLKIQTTNKPTITVSVANIVQFIATLQLNNFNIMIHPFNEDPSNESCHIHYI